MRTNIRVLMLCVVIIICMMLSGCGKAMTDEEILANLPEEAFTYQFGETEGNTCVFDVISSEVISHDTQKSEGIDEFVVKLELVGTGDFSCVRGDRTVKLTYTLQDDKGWVYSECEEVESNLYQFFDKTDDDVKEEIKLIYENEHMSAEVDNYECELVEKEIFNERGDSLFDAAVPVSFGDYTYHVRGYDDAGDIVEEMDIKIEYACYGYVPVAMSFSENEVYYSGERAILGFWVSDNIHNWATPKSITISENGTGYRLFTNISWYTDGDKFNFYEPINGDYEYSYAISDGKLYLDGQGYHRAEFEPELCGYWICDERSACPDTLTIYDNGTGLNQSRGMSWFVDGDVFHCHDFLNGSEDYNYYVSDDVLSLDGYTYHRGD